MTVLRFLTSDYISSNLLLVGIPACSFVVAYSAIIWRSAVRVGTDRYVIVGVTGLVIALGGAQWASQLSVVAARAASPDDISAAFYTYGAYAYVIASILWPLVCCLFVVAVLVIGRRRFDRPGQSLLKALAGGFLLNLFMFISLVVFGIASSGLQRVVCFIASFALASTVAILASRRNRHSEERTS